MITQGIIAAARRRTAGWVDNYAVQYNGTDNGHYLDSPSFASDTAGAIAVDVVIPTLLTSNGAIAILSLRNNNTSAGNLFALQASYQSSVYGDTNTHFSVQGWAGGGWARAGAPAGITAGQKYRVLFQSDGKIYIDGADAGPLIQHIASPRLWTGQWMLAALTGSAPTTFGAGLRLRPDRSAVVFGQCNINNLIYYNAPLTAAEATADHNGGVSFDRRSNAGLNAKLVEFWRFDGNGNAEISSANNLTDYGTPIYIAP